MCAKGGSVLSRIVKIGLYIYIYYRPMKCIKHSGYSTERLLIPSWESESAEYYGPLHGVELKGINRCTMRKVKIVKKSYLNSHMS